MRGAKMAWRVMDTRPIEAVYCFLTLAWGFVLLLPGDAFAKSPSFGPMLFVMPQWAWGLLAMGVGATRTYGVTYDSVGARLLASMGGGIIWTFVWFTMLLASGITTGVAVYGVLSTVNLFIFVKLCRTYLGGPRVARS